MAKGNDPVLIVGAGPTGLMAAALLTACGVPVRVFDKSPSQAKESRAFAIQARTLEAFLSLGLADAFLDEGVIASGLRVHVDGRRAAGFDFEELGHQGTPFPFPLVVPQSRTEAILVDHLSGKGVAVERGVTATGLDQDAAGVTLTATDGEGRSFEARGPYLLGADGAHSVVRKVLGLSFEGAPYAQTFLLADCTLEGELEAGPLTAFFHGQNFALWFPLKGERHGRVIATSRQEVGDPSIAGQGSSPATLAEVEAALREAAQLDLRLSDPVWLSRYRVHHRGVDRYRVGRVFVAGDAAHIHSPAGGQGMNTGLQDAHNLAWKIALALEGSAPDGLLASYDGERRPVGEQVLKATDRAFTMVTAASPWATAARDLILPVFGATFGRSEAVRSRGFRLLSELAIAYEAGPAVAQEPGPRRWREGPAPGARAPDVPVGRKVALFDLLSGYRFHLLAFSRKALVQAEIERIASRLRQLAEESGLGVSTHLVARSLAGRHPDLVRVEWDTVLSTYGLEGEVEEALYLVRPDGYIAWRAPSLDDAACRAFMAERFAGSPAPSAP